MEKGHNLEYLLTTRWRARHQKHKLVILYIWLKIGKRGADVFARDILFAHLHFFLEIDSTQQKSGIINIF